MNTSNIGLLHESAEFDAFLKQLKEKKTRKRVVYIETFSIIMTAVCCVLSGFLAYDDNSTSALALSMDSFLDILTYVIVWCRYFFKSNQSESARPDQIILIYLSFLFILSALWIEFKSLGSIYLKEKPLPSYSYLVISLTQSVVFSLISIVKFRLSLHLERSQVLISSGVNSFAAAISSLSMAIAMSLFIFNPQIWYLDNIFGFVIGILTFIYGFQLLLVNFCLENK